MALRRGQTGVVNCSHSVVEWLGNERSKHGLNAKWNPVLHGDRLLS